MKQGWALKKMGEVLTIERGGSPRTIERASKIIDFPAPVSPVKIENPG